MNIISDVNKNIDLLPSLKNEEENPSLLNNLFSMNFENEVPSELNTEKEFIIKDDEVAIIDYITNLISNFQKENKNFMDLKNIKNQIEKDQNVNPELKENIVNFLKKRHLYGNMFNISISKKITINGKKSINNIDNPKQPIIQKQLLTNTVKTEKKSINVNENNSVSKGNQNHSKNFKNMNAENRNNNIKYEGKKENAFFVKRIKKNNHPNKIYQLPQSNILKYNQLNVTTLQADQKIIENNNLHLINNQIIEASKKNKINENKINNNQIANVQHSIQSNNSSSNFSHQNDSSFSKSTYNSVLENFIDNLDLTQKGWTSKLASRIENAIINGGEEVEFNLKPKNLGVLKISVKLKSGIANVRIITENSFVTSALNQNENYLQKLFNEQGVNLDFSTQSEGHNFGSKNNFNQNSKSENQNNSLQTDSDINKNSEEQIETINENNSSRHMINVIA